MVLERSNLNIKGIKDYFLIMAFYLKGHVPAKILLKNENLAHVVEKKLGTDMLMEELYEFKNWKEWTKYDAIHLLINHRSYLDINYNKTKEFDEFNIMTYNYTFGLMARQILNKIKKEIKI